MPKVLLGIVFALIAAVPTVASADLTITLQALDGSGATVIAGPVTGTKPAPAAGSGVSPCAIPANPGETCTEQFPLIPSTGTFMSTCTTRPCTLFFPSLIVATTKTVSTASPCPLGKTCPLATDLFQIDDISGTTLARVVKTDAPTSDRLEVKGMRVIGLTLPVGGAVFNLKVQTATGDYQSVTPGTYPFAANLNGSFLAASGSGVASACTTGPCALLKVTAVGVTVNGLGSSGTSTVSVPPDPNSGSCTTGGSYDPLSGIFCTTDSSSIQCGSAPPPPATATPCQTTLTANYFAKFVNRGEAFSLPGSGIVGASNVMVQDLGIVELALSGSDFGWINSGQLLSFSVNGSSEAWQPSGAALQDKVFNKNDSASIPVQFVRTTGTPTPTSIDLLAFDNDLLSQQSPDSPKKPGSKFWLNIFPNTPNTSPPTPLLLSALTKGQIGVLSFSNSRLNFDTILGPTLVNIYGVFIDANRDGNPDDVTFSDCNNRSFETVMRVKDKTGKRATLQAEMGRDPGPVQVDSTSLPNVNFTTNCSLPSGFNLLQDHADLNATSPDARWFVNEDFLHPLTFSDAVKRLFAPLSQGGFNFDPKSTEVQAISLVGDPTRAAVNHWVTISNVTYGPPGNTTSLIPVTFTNLTVNCDLPDSGRAIQAQRIAPTTGPLVTIGDSAITNGTCSIQGHLALSDLGTVPAAMNRFIVQVVRGGVAQVFPGYFRVDLTNKAP